MAKTKTEALDSPTTQLVEALVEAIRQTKPVEKKSAVNRVVNTPWTPKDGSPRLKLKRKMYQHGLLIDPDLMTNEEIDLMNKVRPGRYMDNWVSVNRRRDKGIDITYPVKTAAQRMKLVHNFGVRNFKELLERCLAEASDPKKFVAPEDEY